MSIDHVSPSAPSDEPLDSLNFQLDDAAIEEVLQGVMRGSANSSAPLARVTAAADEDQKRAIWANAPVIRLLAPAGSGKTQTLANRIQRLLSEGVSNNAILTLTFDNAAASALREKLQSLGADHQPRTLNAFSYGLLQRYRPKLHKPIAKSRDQRIAFRHMKERLGSLDGFATLWPDNLKDRVFFDFFGILKNYCFDPRSQDVQATAEFLVKSSVSQRAFFSKATTPDEITKIVHLLLQAFREYDRQLESLELMDFDDQKLRCYVALRDEPGLAEEVAGQFRHVIVDEFQDINPLDLELIKSFAARSTLLVTGDDDQAIYGFRGCSPHFILNLASVLGQSVEELELRYNYRCPPNIVEHADRLIRNNTNRAVKTPVAVRKDDAAIKVVNSTTAGVEARAAVRFLKKITQGTSVQNYDDCAILYRTNAQSLPLQLHLLLEGVPYRIKDEHDILKNDQVKTLLGVLRAKLAMVERREPEVSDLLCIPKAYFGRWSREDENKLDAHFRVHGASFQNLLNADASVSRRFAGASFRECVSRAFDSSLGLTPTLQQLAQNFKGLRGMVGSLEDVIDNTAPFGEIFELAASYRGRLSEFVAALEKALSQEQDLPEDDRGRVVLSTYFGAKGLQWHTVVMTGCNDGLIPHSRGDVEEERRLFYVAMTRASANLYLSYLAKSCGHAVSASQFLIEAGLLARA